MDPRWFVDTLQNSDCHVRLYNYLGLHVKAFNAKPMSEDWRINRCRLVLDCWKTAEAQPKAIPATPRNFLWKVWAAKGGSSRGDFNACKLFIAYLRAIWTQALCKGPQAAHLFVPEHFFNDNLMASAYREHLERFKSKS
jgi:hypothetical protein